MDIKWTKTQLGYTSSARHWSEEQGKYIQKYAIKNYGKGWEVIGYFRRKNELDTISASSLKEAKFIAQRDWDSIPTIETEEDKGWRLSTGFKY